MTKKIYLNSTTKHTFALFLTLLFLLTALCGCGVKDFTFATTLSNLLDKNYKLMDRTLNPPLVTNTNISIFEGDAIKAENISNFFDVQKLYYSNIYSDFKHTFNALDEVTDLLVTYDNRFPVVTAGNNSWSRVISTVCLSNAVLSYLEFWDTTKTGEAMWICLFKCRLDNNGTPYDFANKLFNVLKQINTVVQRTTQDAEPSKSMAYSWALKKEVEIAKYDNYVVMYTSNASSLIV